MICVKNQLVIDSAEYKVTNQKKSFEIIYLLRTFL